MLRKTIIVACASLVMLSGCVTTYEHHEAFQPKLTETGGPKELYSIRNEQVTGLFTPGMTKAQITERFGNPAMAGSGVDKEGKPNSWTVYTYFRGYSHVDTNFNTTIVNRSTSAGLSFDSTDKLIDVSFSRYQKFSLGAQGMRDATEEEVARYLGAPQVLDIKPASVVAGKTTTAAPAALRPPPRLPQRAAGNSAPRSASCVPSWPTAVDSRAAACMSSASRRRVWQPWRELLPAT